MFMVPVELLKAPRPLPVESGFIIAPAALLLAASYGLLVAFAFAVPPLARAGALPAQRMFRGSVESWPWPSVPTD
jgi:predicted lysophospholipase L1 biosynthesis ABC-type transport system permease subunit